MGAGYQHKYALLSAGGPEHTHTHTHKHTYLVYVAVCIITFYGETDQPVIGRM